MFFRAICLHSTLSRFNWSIIKYFKCVDTTYTLSTLHLHYPSTRWQTTSILKCKYDCTGNMLRGIQSCHYVCSVTGERFACFSNWKVCRPLHKSRKHNVAYDGRLHSHQHSRSVQTKCRWVQIKCRRSVELSTLLFVLNINELNNKSAECRQFYIL